MGAAEEYVPGARRGRWQKDLAFHIRCLRLMTASDAPALPREAGASYSNTL